MKLINKLLIVAFLLGGSNACDNLDLDLQQDPNQITPEKASLNDLYNQIQLSFQAAYNSSQDEAGEAARMYYAFGFSYTAHTTENTFNGLWNSAYAGLFPDVDALIGLSDAAVAAGGNAFDIHVGSAKILKAYTMMTLVDLLGNVPNTDAGQGTNVISPTTDLGSDVYTAAIALLDDAIADLTGTTAGAPAFDNFYGGDPDQWIKAANSLKLRAALNMGNGTMFSSLIGGSILGSGDDFQYNFGNQRINPNSRHPRYNNHYESGDGDYLSNYYMWSLREGKLNVAGNTIIDPRRRYYFYRKIEDAFSQDLTTYSCHYTDDPNASVGSNLNHWAGVDPRLPYCVVADGYSGRDHLNGSGIPPDGPIRTSYGLYPFGGDFDDDTFDDTRELGTRGGLGAGIHPVMLSSFVDFYRAEAALTLGTGENARTLLESGIRASMAKVVSFEGLVSAKMSEQRTLKDGSSGTIRDLFGTDQAAIDFYVSQVLGLYDAAGANQLDVVIKEFHIAAWGNGFEAYNMYRRTGYPANLQPGLEPSTGTVTDPFPRSFLYPVDHITRNANAVQKTLDVPVFWDPMKSLR